MGYVDYCCFPMFRLPSGLAFKGLWRLFEHALTLKVHAIAQGFQKHFGEPLELETVEVALIFLNAMAFGEKLRTSYVTCRHNRSRMHRREEQRKIQCAHCKLLLRTYWAVQPC